MALLKRMLGKIKKQFRFYDVITPERDEWEIVEKLQNSGKFPPRLKQVFVYSIPRQFERNVLEMEHAKMVSVKLTKPLYPLQVSPAYKETIVHEICYNPVAERLHVYLASHESLQSLLYRNVKILTIS